MGRKMKSTSLTGKHHLAIAKLIKGEKATDVAKSLGVDVSTIYTWQKWPVFQERQAQYVESIARQELDRGLEEAQFVLNESLAPIVMWMKDVVLGITKIEDPKRWRMALDLLHHAGILDKQAALKAEALPQGSSTSVNLNLDQRRQAVLSSGNVELQKQLEKFSDRPRNVIDA